MIIEGLKQNEAVKFNEVYVVCLYSGEYLVDGLEYRSNTQQHVVRSLDIQRKVTKPRQLSHYETEDGQRISVEEMRKVYSEKIHPHLDEDDDWDCDLETEMECRKLQDKLNKFKTVYLEPEVVFEDVEIKVVGVQEDTGSDFISTPFLLGKTTWNRSGIYKVRLSDIAFSEYGKLKNENPEVNFTEVRSHSSLRFMRVSGEYVFNNEVDSWIKDKGVTSIVMDLEEARKLESTVRNKVRSLVNMRLKNTLLPEPTHAKVYSDLSKVYQKLLELDVKVKSEGKHNSVLKSVSDMRRYLMEDFNQ